MKDICWIGEGNSLFSENLRIREHVLNSIERNYVKRCLCTDKFITAITVKCVRYIRRGINKMKYEIIYIYEERRLRRVSIWIPLYEMASFARNENR